MRKTAGPRRPARAEGRVSRTYRLRLSKLREPRKRTLDLAVFQRELIKGTRAMLGVEIASTEPGQ